MTAVTSTAKKSFFGTHLRNKIIESKKILIINLVLHLIGLPLIATVLLRLVYLDEHNLPYDNSESLIVVSVIALVIALLSGIVIALGNFRYLYTKSLVDMTYSLPVTTKQRFVADYLSGLAIYMIPAVLGTVLSLIILVIGSSFVDMSELWTIFPELFRAGLIVLVGMLLLYTFTVLTTIFCGSTFEAIFSVITSNIIIPATFFAGFYMIQDAADYVLSEASLIYNAGFTATSPIGVIFAFANYLDNTYFAFYGTDFASKYFMRWLVPALIMIAVYFIAAYLLYKHRKAEQVSKPYVYRIFYYIIMALAVFCLMSIFLINEIGITSGIILCAILFFIVEVITKRGFTRFWESILRYAISIAAVFGFFLICQYTYGFGCADYVPREAAVDSVSISSYDMTAYSDMIFDDKDVIRETVRLHENIIAQQNSEDSDYGNIVSQSKIVSYNSDPEIYTHHAYDYISITYYLKNGSTVIRDYELTSDLCGDLSAAIALSDDHSDMLSSDMALYAFNTNGFNWYESLKNVSSDAVASVSVMNKLHLNEQTRNISYSQMMALKLAYKTDLLAMTDEEYRTADVYGYFFGDSRYVIRDTFINTIEALGKLGFEDMTIDREYIEEEISSSRVRMNILTDIKTFYAIGDSKYRELDKFTITSHTYSTSGYSAEITDKEPDDCLVKLLERATPIIIDSAAAGAIEFQTDSSGVVLFLPDTDENRALLEEARNMYIEGKLVTSDTFYEYDEEYYYYD